MTSHTLVVWSWALAFLCVGSIARGDDSSTKRADEFVALLKQSEFGQCASAFHYPPNYTSAELAADTTVVTQFLEGLLQEIGNIETIRRVDKPTGLYLDLAIGGGDLPYWSSRPELSHVQMVTYEARTKKEGQVFFVLSLVQSDSKWELRTFSFELPASRRGAQQRILDLGRKLYPPNQQAPGKTANLSLNPDALPAALTHRPLGAG